MDVERYLLSSALTGIISQRLAKMLCPKCKIEREATAYEKKIFKKVLKEDIEKLYDANHDGCDYCHNGYKGRIAVQEVLEIDDEIRDALNDEKLEKEDLREMVYTSNVITLLQDGLEKVLEGITSFEEIYRIIEIDSDITEDYGAELTEANKERLKQEKQNKVKEETNSEVTDSAKSINSDDKTSSVDDTATISTNSQNVESIINKNEKNEEKSDIIITPPMIPAYTDQDNYNNEFSTEQPSDINSATIDIPSIQNSQNEINNQENNNESSLNNSNTENNVEINSDGNNFYNTNSLEVPSIENSVSTSENMNNNELNPEESVSYTPNNEELSSNQNLNFNDENINNNESDKINFSPLNSNGDTVSEPSLSLLTELPQNYNQIDNSNQVTLQPTISTINDSANPTLIENTQKSEPTLIENN